MLTREIDKTLYNSYSDDIPVFLKKIYAARSVTESQLALSLSGLLKPNFDQLDVALKLLEQAISENRRILIVGDFDADGATASSVAIKSLRMMGSKFIDFPNLPIIIFIYIKSSKLPLSLFAYLPISLSDFPAAPIVASRLSQ